jgi:hypothetical protein
MYGKQRILFEDGAGDDMLGTPFSKLLFPEECVPAVEAVFYAELGTAKSDVPCPLYGGKSAHVSVPVAPHCDCPRAHELVRMLGRGLPHCSENRCPVRIVLLRMPA